MFDTNIRTLVVVGAQWGDEGKGKLVDVLAEKADWVVRYQGGANAGHTVHIGDRSTVLHQIPSGILHAGVRCAIGNGVVLDPETVFVEVDALVRDGVDVEGRLYLSDRAHLVMPYHKLVDKESAASKAIGTTGRGIGPAYEDKVARRGIRVLDLRHPERLRALVEKTPGGSKEQRVTRSTAADDDIDAALNDLQDTLEGAHLSGNAGDITSIPELTDFLRYMKYLTLIAARQQKILRRRACVSTLASQGGGGL